MYATLLKYLRQLKVPRFALNPTTGAVEGLVDPESGGLVPFNLKPLTVELANINNVGARPSGADWLFSAAQDLDTFTGYLQFEPTIFFDPDDTTSLNYGTNEEPYNTLADVNRVMKGNRAGTVLGIKRGSHLYTHSTMTGIGLNITCYGTATNPVLIVPYGDPTKPMPVIDGSEVTGAGSFVWVDQGGGVWRMPLATADSDVFENDVRCLKKNATPAAPGECQWTGGYLYYYPRETSNPNDGSIRIPYTQWPVQYEIPNVAAQMGNVKLIGIDIRYGRGNNFRVCRNNTSVAAVTGMGAVDLLFCRLKNNGYDEGDGASAAARAALTGSTTCASYQGLDATHRTGASETISSRVIGNDISGGTHHAVEFSHQDNGLVEYNYLHDCFGAPIEYFCDCSNNVFRNNRCENFSSHGRLDTIQGSFALLYNYTQATPGAALAFDDTHALNVGNQVYNNWFKDCSQVMFVCVGGSASTPHKIYNNTCDIDHDAIFGADVKTNLPSGLNTKRSATPAPTGTTSAPNGFVDFSNNLLYYRYSPICKAGTGYLNPTFVSTEVPGVGAAIPTGNKNCYFNQTGFGTACWTYTSPVANFTTYKAAFAAYSLDQDSLCANGTHPISGSTYGNNGGAQTLTTLKYLEATGKPDTGSSLIQGGANVNANRLTDYIGQTVIAVATPAIGCYER